VFLPEGALSGTLSANWAGSYEFPIRVTGN
jgi:hypothetical protein